jgi:hypothetical protein
MWIGILIILAGGLYLAWCLAKGKLFVTLGTDLHKNTKLIDRADRPETFWITWVTSAIALIIFAIYLIRTAVN